MATRSVRGVSRRVCERCAHIHYAEPKVAVGVAVFRDDQLLLVRRTMEPGRGLWALPGGFLDLGEDPRLAAVREAAEEAGVEVAVGDVIDIFANSPDTTIQGNYIGVNAAGTAAVPNFFDGVFVAKNTNYHIGGPGAGQRQLPGHSSDDELRE